MLAAPKYLKAEIPKMSSVLDDVVEGLEPVPDLISVMAASQSAAVLAVDIGTSGVRAALFDERGQEIPDAAVRIGRVATNLVELSTVDAEELFAVVAATIDQLLSLPAAFGIKVKYFAISCFWHSLLGVDVNGDAATPVFGWSETRAATAAQSLREQLSETEIHARTGCRFHSSYWPAKLLWLRKDRAAAFREIKQWHCFSSYLTLRLFADADISVSLASGTGLMNQKHCEWDFELLKALQIAPESLPNIASTEFSQQPLQPEYAERWPQLVEARLFYPVADGAANNIGAGCSTPDRLALMIGTSGAMRIVQEDAPAGALPKELWSYRVDRSRIVIGGALSDGGGLYHRLKDLLLPGEEGSSVLEQLEQLEPDTHGLTILPFWSGERSPGWALNASGGIYGLTHQTTNIEILRAAMEAVAYRFVLIFQALKPFTRGATITATGNALHSSRVWLQILADALNSPIRLSDTPEASTRGAALLALEAAGKIQNINDADYEMGEIVEPDTSRHARYLEGLARQQKLYQAVITATK